jgi:hypothetical protein
MMPTPNPASVILPPKVPTGQEIFDAIMGHIEPELTSEGLKTIPAKYKGESREDLQRRKQRYELAFERYEQAYEGYMQTLHSQVARYRRESFTNAELEDRRDDNRALGQLGSAILSLT